MAADINKPKIRDKSVKLLRKKPKILVNKAWICRHITKYYEIFKDNDESMYTSSGSIIATTVNFDQPFDVCRQSFHHYPRLLPKPAKFEKNPPNGYRVIRKTKCGAGGAAGAGSSPIHYIW